jgi:metal-responsive CopG/Arc/MetJ family transcriptional regulator
MPQKRSLTPKKRTSVLLEEDLIERFHASHSRFGDFSHVVNDLLKKYLDELDEKENAFHRERNSL